MLWWQEYWGYNHEAVRVVFHNVYSPSVKLDESTEWDGGNSYEKLQYSEVSENDYLDLYVPDSDEPMPMIVMVHGGGFVFLMTASPDRHS